MCGIIYARRFDGKAVGEMVAKRYRAQRSRGHAGFGYAAVGEAVAVTRAEIERHILEPLTASRASEILFHHRLPTSTPNVLDATHPIVVSHVSLTHEYYVVHNGIIDNADELHATHSANGFDYTTAMTETLRTRTQSYTTAYFNDSEAFAIDVARTIEGVQSEMRASGSIAFIALQANKITHAPVRLFYGRNDGSPLTAKRTQHAFILSSEGGAVTLQANVLYAYDYVTDTQSTQVLHIGRYTPPPTYPLWSTYYLDEPIQIGSSSLDELQRQQAELAELIGIAEDTGDMEELDDLWEQYMIVEDDIQSLNP